MILTNLDKWDRREFLDCMESMPELEQADLEGTRKVHNYTEYMADVFGSMYKYNPKPRDAKDAKLGEKWADKIFSEITTLPEWKTLRERTVMHPEAAAAATAEFCQRFVDVVPDMGRHRRQEQQSVPLDKALQEMKTATTKVEDKFETPMAADLLHLDQLADKIDPSEIRFIARDACELAIKAADEMDEAITSLGFGSGHGDAQYASPAQKKEVAQRLYQNKHLRQIAKMAGRMRRIASQKQKTKARHGVDEICDITTGDDIARLIPSEMLKLTNPIMRLDFYKRFIERDLMQYKLRGREPQGKGPIVVCVDESYSMSGTRDVWSKGVCLALLQIAQQQKRDMAIVHFDSKTTRVGIMSGKINAVDIMDEIAYFTGGGTSYESPLTEAVQLICKTGEYANRLSNGSKFTNSDIIFITDDDCVVSPKFLEVFNKFRSESKTNVTSIMIGGTGRVCKQFSDTVVQLDDISNDNNATDVMFTL